MQIITLLALLLGSVGFDLHAQTPSPADLLKFHFQPTNAVPVAARPATNSPEYSTNRDGPVIEFHSVPIFTVIEHLARMADINYILQPGLYAEVDGGPIPEPNLTLVWKGVTAQDALDRVCQEYDLKVVKNSCSGIVHIIRLGEPKYFIAGKVLGLTTNQPDINSALIPLIQFWAVPVDIALINLIRQSGRPIDVNLKAGAGDHRFDPMPEVFVRWVNVTSEQAILALCEAYDLELVTDPATGNLQITPRKFKRHHRI